MKNSGNRAISPPIPIIDCTASTTVRVTLSTTSAHPLPAVLDVHRILLLLLYLSAMQRQRRPPHPHPEGRAAPQEGGGGGRRQDRGPEGAPAEGVGDGHDGVVGGAPAEVETVVDQGGRQVGRREGRGVVCVVVVVGAGNHPQSREEEAAEDLHRHLLLLLPADSRRDFKQVALPSCLFFSVDCDAALYVQS